MLFKSYVVEKNIKILNKILFLFIVKKFAFRIILKIELKKTMAMSH